MKRGDLVRVKASRELGTTAYLSTTSRIWAHISSGEVSVLLQDMKDVGGYIDVLHPKHGVCLIHRDVLEAV
jgi:hypothetical protein